MLNFFGGLKSIMSIVLLVSVWICSLILTGYLSWKLKPQAINKTENVTMDLTPWLFKPRNGIGNLTKSREKAWKYARQTTKENPEASRQRLYDSNGNPWVFYKYGAKSVTLCKIKPEGHGYDSNEENKLVMNWDEFDKFFPEYTHWNPNNSITDSDADCWVKVKKEEFENLMNLYKSQDSAYEELQRLLG